MSSVSINGFGDDLCINDVRIGDLTPDDHEKIEKEKGGQNYAPLENVVISKVKDSSTLIARKPLSLIHISEPTRLGMISYAVFCLKII